MKRFKDYLPKGLYARTLASIILPVVLLQILIAAVFFDDHWKLMSRRLADAVAGDVALTVWLFDRNPTPEALAPIAREVWRTTRLKVTLEPQLQIPAERPRNFFGVLDRTLENSLRAQLGARAFWFDAVTQGDYVEIRVPTHSGVLRFLAYRKRAYATNGHVFVIWVAGLTALLTTVSILFIRNQVRPIRRLAEAAQAYGTGREAPDFKPSGAREVRQAAAAVMEMRDRIQRHVEQRTALLASVSHDLRTPLTRLKLQLAMMTPSPDLDAARADLSDMERMLDEYLEFARGQIAEDPTRTDIGAILREAATAAGRDGKALAVDIEPDLIAPARAGALKRCFANLIENAASFGEAVHVAARRSGDAVEICVEDDGPGIAPEQYEEAFRPFTRLDPSRNQNRKGVGLGLAIARDVARGLGGDVTLSPSALGGLKALVRIPA